MNEYKMYTCTLYLHSSFFFIISVPNISNATREEEVSYEGNQTRSSEDWREGRRIVELDVLATGLRACLKCGLPLQLGHSIDIQTYGLGCLLKVSNSDFNNKSKMSEHFE